jgi:molecular chaperone GrpE
MAENEKNHDDDQIPEQVKEPQGEVVSESEEVHTVTPEENNKMNQQATDSLLRTIEEKDLAMKEMTKQYQRLQADFENFRRRTRQEKEDLSTLVAENIVLELLPVVDNFERALTSAADDASTVRSGVELIFRQMKSALEKLGVSIIEATGKSFDPNEHQAVMRVENAELEDGLIVEELQKGYKVKTRVIRPSMVKVVNNN